MATPRRTRKKRVVKWSAPEHYVRAFFEGGPHAAYEAFLDRLVGKAHGASGTAFDTKLTRDLLWSFSRREAADRALRLLSAVPGIVRVTYGHA